MIAPEGWGIIIAAVFLGLGQLLNIYLTHRGSARSDVNRAATAAQLAPIATDAKVIVGHVNSEATRMQGEKDALERENVILREMIAKQDGDKQLLAQAVATRPSVPEPSAPSALAAAGPAESLKQIDKHIKATAKNTERVKADVQDLKDKA